MLYEFHLNTLLKIKQKQNVDWYSGMYIAAIPSVMNPTPFPVYVTAQKVN